MKADLHIHTTASDGRCTPRQICEQAKQAGLATIAITDHDTVEGIKELQAIPVTGITIIPGIEINTDMETEEIHILGYYIDLQEAKLAAELDKIRQDRFIRVRKIIDKLDRLGFPIEYERVLSIAGEAKSIGRPHIAQALLEKGYFSSMEEVFARVLDKDAPAYVPHYKLSPVEAIRLIQEAGGIAVLAHPGHLHDPSQIIPLIQNGLDGIEVYHPTHTEEQIRFFENLAQQYDLKITGGSDFHAIPGRFPEHLGEYTIPEELVYTLEPDKRKHISY